MYQMARQWGHDKQRYQQVPLPFRRDDRREYRDVQLHLVAKSTEHQGAAQQPTSR